MLRFVVAANVAFALLPKVAHADGAGPSSFFRLSWVREDSAESCPDARVVAQRVREHLGRDPFSESAGIAAEIVVAGQSGGFVARIRIRGEGSGLRGERILTSDENCDTLASAVALALAMYMDPNAALRPHAPEPQALVPSAPPAAQQSAVALPAANLPEPSTDDSRGHGGAVAGGVLVSNGLLPGLSPGARISAELRPLPRLRVLVTGGFLPEQHTADRRFAFGLAAGGAGACVDLVATPFVELAPCASILAGEIHSVVLVLSPTTPGGRLWMGAAALAQARFHVLPPLFVEIGAGAWIPFLRHTFEVTSWPQPIFQEAALAPVVDFGVGSEFP
jgi:hypothetical protein